MRRYGSVRRERSKAYIQAIKDMDKGVKISVKTSGANKGNFLIDIGLYQGATLNPFLFTIIMDVLTKGI